MNNLSCRHPFVSDCAQRPLILLTSIYILGVQQSDSVGLVVISEEDTHRTLLIHRIVCEDIYFRQGGEHAHRLAASSMHLKW